MSESVIDLIDRDFDRDSISSVRREVERHSVQAGLDGPALYRPQSDEVVLGAVCRRVPQHGQRAERGQRLPGAPALQALRLVEHQHRPARREHVDRPGAALTGLDQRGRYR